MVAIPSGTPPHFAKPNLALGSTYMSMETILIILVVVLLLGGGGFFYNRRGR